MLLRLQPEAEGKFVCFVLSFCPVYLPSLVRNCNLVDKKGIRMVFVHLRGVKSSEKKRILLKLFLAFRMLKELLSNNNIAFLVFF